MNNSEQRPQEYQYYPPYPYPQPVIVMPSRSSLANKLLLIGVVGVGTYFILKYLGYDIFALLREKEVEKYQPPQAEEFRIVGFYVSGENIEITKHEALKVDVLDSVVIRDAKLRVYVSGVEEDQKVGINVEFGIYDGYYWPKWYNRERVGSDILWFNGRGRFLIDLDRGDEGTYDFVIDELEIPFRLGSEQINALAAHLAFKVWADGYEDDVFIVRTGIYVDTRD